MPNRNQYIMRDQTRDLITELMRADELDAKIPWPHLLGSTLVLGLYLLAVV